MAAVQRTGEREGWDLTREAVEQYAEQIVQLIGERDSESRIEAVVFNYYHDNRRVRTLVDEAQRGHVEAWQWARDEILIVMRSSGLGWSTDRSVGQDDLLQLVHMEVARSIGTYRYASSLRTWLHSVALRRLRRFLRDSLAEKRAVRPEPFEQVPTDALLADPVDTDGLASALAQQLEAIVSDEYGERVALIFRLHLHHDQSTAAIGKLLKLHPSRVRAIVAEVRRWLRDHPEVRAWLDDA